MELQRHPICLTDSDHDYISDKILHRHKIEYKININVKGDKDKIINDSVKINTCQF